VNTWLDEFGSELAGRRVLITGANGFIGGHLCETLYSLNADVYGLDLANPIRISFPEDRIRYVDLTDFDTLRTAISEIKPQLIYHLASLVTAKQDISLVLPMLYNNLVSTVHLMLALSEIGCERLVLMSSSEERTEGNPGSPYAAAKAATSKYAGMFFQLYNLPVTTIRLFLAYGPRQNPEKLIPYTIISLLRNQIPSIDSGDRICDFVYVFDVVRGLLRTGIQPGLEGKTVELGTGGGIRIKDMVSVLIDIMHSEVKPQFTALPTRIGEQALISNSNLSSSLALLNWEPRWSLREGLIETVAWYQNKMENEDGGY